MKHSHLKNIFMCLCMFASISAFSEPVEIDGIFYNFLEDNTAEVTSGSYSGAVAIPSSVTFNGATYSVTSIGEKAFNGCSGLTSVTIPEGVISIGNYTFYRCSNLTSVTIPGSVKSIGHDAFSLCRSLTSAVIPNGVESISSFVFYGCLSLASVTIPESVTIVERDAFSYCCTLTSVTLPENVTSIGNYAFYNCTNLAAVNIPEKVTFIGENAFYGCSALTSVTIPSALTEIGASAFLGCSALKAVNISDLAAWCAIAFESSSSNPLSYAHKFYLNGAEVKNLVIPEGVTSIESFAFSGCTSLNSVNIPEGVTGISQGAFSDCAELANVSIPDGLTSIGKEAFKNCTGLIRITCNAVQTPSVTSDAFTNVDVNSVVLVVPFDSEEQYRNNAVWGKFMIETNGGAFAKESDEDAIRSVNSDVWASSEVYDLGGRRQNTIQHGLNLIRMSDGSIRKVLVK